MKRKFVVLLMVVLAALSFVACDSNAGNGEDAVYPDICIDDLLAGTWKYGSGTDYISLKFSQSITDPVNQTVSTTAMLDEVKGGNTYGKSSISVSISGAVISFTCDGKEYKYRGWFDENKQNLTLEKRGNNSLLRLHNDKKFTLTKLL